MDLRRPEEARTTRGTVRKITRRQERGRRGRENDERNVKAMGIGKAADVIVLVRTSWMCQYAQLPI